MTITGVPVSSSKSRSDDPMLISSDFLQMTPVSKQSMFSAVTLSITSALLCGGGKTPSQTQTKSYCLKMTAASARAARYLNKTGFVLLSLGL